MTYQSVSELPPEERSANHVLPVSWEGRGGREGGREGGRGDVRGEEGEGRGGEGRGGEGGREGGRGERRGGEVYGIRGNIKMSDWEMKFNILIASM